MMPVSSRRRVVSKVARTSREKSTACDVFQKHCNLSNDIQMVAELGPVMACGEEDVVFSSFMKMS